MISRTAELMKLKKYLTQLRETGIANEQGQIYAFGKEMKRYRASKRSVAMITTKEYVGCKQ